MNENEAKLSELELGCFPEAGVSGAVVLQSEYSTFLMFNAQSVDHVPIGIAVVEIAVCVATQFGYPNDEALAGHPLYSFGLKPYRAYEVLNSPWLKTLALQNKRNFPNADFTKGRRHFIFSFHDSTFECIGKDVKVTIAKESYAEVMSGLVKRIGLHS
jgi:hypothetical protein